MVDNKILEIKKLIYTNRKTEAEKIIMQYLKSNGDDCKIKFELAILLLKIRKIDEGKTILEELLETNQRKFAMMELGKLALEIKNYVLARYYFKGLLNTKLKEDALTELAKLEMQEENYSEAKNYYTMLEEIYRSNSFFDKSIDKLKKIIFLEIHLENYENAHILLKQLLETINIIVLNNKRFKINLNKLKLDSADLMHLNQYLKYKLGILSFENISKDNYFLLQSINYSKEKAIQHISRHLDENDRKRKHSTFKKNIDIELLYNEISLLIREKSPYAFSLVDKYCVLCRENIGFSEGVETNKINVITIPNTKKIITMYPINSNFEIADPKKLILNYKK